MPQVAPHPPPPPSGGGSLVTSVAQLHFLCTVLISFFRTSDLYLKHLYTPLSRPPVADWPRGLTIFSSDQHCLQVVTFKPTHKDQTPNLSGFTTVGRLSSTSVPGSACCTAFVLMSTWSLLPALQLYLGAMTSAFTFMQEAGDEEAAEAAAERWRQLCQRVVQVHTGFNASQVSNASHCKSACHARCSCGGSPRLVCSAVASFTTL